MSYKIVSHDTPEYRRRWEGSGSNKWNGAFYYSKEIVSNIIPRVDTDRNWVTVNQPGLAFDHSIVFVHNNLHPEHYEWLSLYKDLVLVCGIPETCPKVEHLGKTVYLPLSVDVEYVSKFIRPKKKSVAMVGRPAKINMGAVANAPHHVDVLSELPRQYLLEKMALYRAVYAVGRTAIEARILGCDVLPYDERFPDPSIWKVLDNREAAEMLQKHLDELDK